MLLARKKALNTPAGPLNHFVSLRKVRMDQDIPSKFGRMLCRSCFSPRLVARLFPVVRTSDQGQVGRVVGVVAGPRAQCILRPFPNASRSDSVPDTLDEILGRPLVEDRPECWQAGTDNADTAFDRGPVDGGRARILRTIQGQ